MHSKPALPPLAWHAIRRPPGAPPLGAYVLQDPDALLDGLDDAAFAASDERMPYYALLWPSGEALAAAVADGPALAGLSALDLGCGCGAVGLAAGQQGARVTCLDWAPEAETLVERGARRLGLPVPRFVLADWRRPPADLGRFDRVLAADVLYEARNAEPVAAFLRTHLAPGGEAWLTDPGRRHASDFPDVAATAGLALRETRRLPPPNPEPDAQAITLYRFGRSG